MSIINDKLGAEESLLEMLYHFLEQDPPLNPLLASFFSKTIGNLIARKTEQVQQLLGLGCWGEHINKYCTANYLDKCSHVPPPLR